MVSFKNVSSVGGTGIIPLNFPEDVPKYDPSSFYNWEQDNIPIWVLEQRGNTLYKAMGSPGGNPEGVTFTLSSAGNYDESKGIYDSIDDIVERIPKRLKFPVLIEICRYGNLGKLDLANITCEGEGKLEVKNKAFFSDVNASAYAVDNVSGSPADAALGNRQYVRTVYSRYASATLLNVSSTRSQTVFGNESNWESNARFFVGQGPDTDRQANNLSVYVASAANQFEFGSTYGLFKLPHIYDWNNDFGAGGQAGVNASGWGDATPYFGSGTGLEQDFMVKKRANVYTQGQSTFFGYGAWFSAVSLKDCQGTVIIRDVLVDGGNNQNDLTGADGQIHGGEYGFDIENSEVYLDNIASMRNSLGGIRAANSRLKITGHCVAYRNYTKTGKGSSKRLQNGTGLYALNTDILWDNTAYEGARKYLNYFGKSNRGIDVRNCTLRGGNNFTWDVSALPNGGSQLHGLSRTVNSLSLASCSGAGGDTLTTLINTADCNEHGFYAEGSDIEFDGRFNSYLNVKDGIHLRRSQARLTQFTSNNNGGWGINLAGSQVTYGYGSENFLIKPDAYSTVTPQSQRIKAGIIGTAASFGGNATAFTADVNSRIRNRAQFHVDSNNQNVLIDKSSSLSPAKINSIPKYFGQWGGCDWVHTDAADAAASLTTSVKYIPASHFGATPYRAQNQPGIVVTNNSDGEFVNVSYAVRSNDTGKGKIAVASNGSNLVFRGTSGCTTTMNYYPVNDNTKQFRSWLSAGVVATDNSNVEFTGPTKSARFGVPFLAENNSNLKFKPPTFVGTDNILDISGYTLIENTNKGASANHTSVEVHSTRAGVVANNQSNIYMYGLGGKVLGNETGASPTNIPFDSVDVLTTDYADTILGDQNSQFVRSTSGGYVKFYPHGFTSSVITDYSNRIQLNPGDASNTPFVTTTRQLTDLDAAQQNAMTGGMCVRAVQDSSVDVNLVNFYYQGLPKDVSGAFYNINGTGCEKGNGDVIPDGGPKTSDNTFEIINNDTPGAGWIGTEIPAGGAVLPVGTGEGSLSNFTKPLFSTVTNNTITGGGTVNGEGTGALYSTVGQSTGGGAYNSSFANNQDPGSMSVIGDERAPAPYASVNNTDQKYRYRAYLRSKFGSALKLYAPTNPNCMGSQIQIWNIADTSRIHAANILANGMDPCTWSLSAGAPGGGSNCHGPRGKWFNGVSLDYFGLGGRRTTYGGCGPVFANTGIFRLMLSTRGDLKSFYDVSTLSGSVSVEGAGWRHNATSGGSPVDQINGAGYTHWTQNVRVLGSADLRRRLTGQDSDFPSGLYQLSSCLRVFGWGMPSNDPSAGVATMQPRLGGFSAFNATSGVQGQPSGAWIYTTAEPATPLPPLGMDSLGYMRNWFDESAMGMWQNAQHLAEDKVNGVSIYRSTRGAGAGGEGRDSDPTVSTYGVGVRSLNLFDLERLM